ncbi:hypothetical protein D3C81_2230840 [compost metagenome]
MIAHKARKQVLQRMNTTLRHNFLVRYTETQIKDRDFITVRRVHSFCDANCRRFHSGMVDSKAI